MAKEWRLGQSSLEDVFEMAALVEQGGYEFYERLIASASNRGAKKELAFLRDEEAGAQGVLPSSSSIFRAGLRVERSGPSWTPFSSASSSGRCRRCSPLPARITISGHWVSA